MGIQGLLPFLGKSTRDAHISEFENEFVAVDAYCWLHKGIYSCAYELATDKPTEKYATYCLRYIEMLLHFKVKPILVFDGRQLSSKKETEKKRRESRKKKYEKGKELMRAGKHLEGKKLLGESVDVTHKLALTLIKKCREKNIDCIVAPYEADAQLAFLSLEKIVKCVISEDSDLLAYGSERVMFKMDTSGRGKLVEKNDIHLSLSMTPEEFSEDLFRYMCILSGCDYLPSLPSIGPANALKFIKMLKGNCIYSVLPKLPIYVKKNIEVPPEYITGFKIADNTFKHQLVYNPFTRSQVPVRPVENDDDIVGVTLSDDTAFNLAVGNIDPMTMKLIDTYDPDKTKKGFTILWRKKSEPEGSGQPVPEAKKRQRENSESSSVSSVTNDLKKQRTPFNIIRFKNSSRNIPDSGFDFDPKISVGTKSVAKNLEESKLLKSRYFSWGKDKRREKKQIESENDRRKDESYEDYLQRLYNEYFPLRENENGGSEEREGGFNGVNEGENEISEGFCCTCKNNQTLCTCSKENGDVSESQKLNEYIKDLEELKKSKENSSAQPTLLDEIHRNLVEGSGEDGDDKPEKKSPGQKLSLNFSKILSNGMETPRTTTEAGMTEKENTEIVPTEKEECVRSPSPVFKVQRDVRISNRTCRLGNISDTAATPTSIYFSSCDSESLSEPVFSVSSSRTPSSFYRKMPSARSFNSVPAKVGKKNLKSSSVNRTLFQFGFKKERREENDEGA